MINSSTNKCGYSKDSMELWKPPGIYSKAMNRKLEILVADKTLLLTFT